MRRSGEGGHEPTVVLRYVTPDLRYDCIGWREIRRTRMINGMDGIENKYTRYIYALVFRIVYPKVYPQLCNLRGWVFWVRANLYVLFLYFNVVKVSDRSS